MIIRAGFVISVDGISKQIKVKFIQRLKLMLSFPLSIIQVQGFSRPNTFQNVENQLKYYWSASQLQAQNFWLIFIIYYLSMSSIESILQENEAQSSSFHYDEQDRQTENKEKEPQRTNDLCSIFLNLNYDSLNNQLSQYSSYIQIQPQKSIQTKRIPKRLIEVSKQKRHAYLMAKKGRISNSNDLSTHVTTLIRSTFEEYKTFFCPDKTQAQFLQQFLTSNENLSSLRKLLIESRQFYRDSSQEASQIHSELGENPISLNQFLSEQFSNSSIVQKILLRKKMSFSKKQLLIRYLGAIKKSFGQPENLKSWKNLLLN